LTNFCLYFEMDGVLHLYEIFIKMCEINALRIEMFHF
jgi:hypothetical protein